MPGAAFGAGDTAVTIADQTLAPMELTVHKGKISKCRLEIRNGKHYSHGGPWTPRVSGGGPQNPWKLNVNICVCSRSHRHFHREWTHKILLHSQRDPSMTALGHGVLILGPLVRN